MIYYNGRLKRLGLEYKVLIKIPLKIARKITMLAQELKDKEKK